MADPELTAASPIPGRDLALTREEARFTPITLTVSNPDDQRWVVWVKVANDDRGFVVYDSVVGFLPPFDSSRSTWVGNLLTVLPVGGWPDAPQWFAINGNGNSTITPIRAGAAGSDPPPHT